MFGDFWYYQKALFDAARGLATLHFDFLCVAVPALLVAAFLIYIARKNA
jgi:hypothetical protein